MKITSTGERASVANSEIEPLVTEREVAAATRLSLASIRRRRLFGQPPKWVKVGFAVRYRISDVTAWLESLASVTPNTSPARTEIEANSSMSKAAISRQKGGN